MSRIVLKNKPMDVLNGAQSLLLAAPAALWKEGWADELSLVPGLEPLVRAASQSGPDVHRTLGGAQGTTRLIAVVLPDRVSRHNSDSKSEALWQALAGAMPSPDTKTGVILGVEDPEHYTPLAVAELLTRLKDEPQAAAGTV